MLKLIFNLKIWISFHYEFPQMVAFILMDINDVIRIWLCASFKENHKQSVF